MSETVEEEEREFTSFKLDKNDYKNIKERSVKFDEDLKETLIAVELFTNSKVHAAEKLLRAKCKVSFIHCHGNAMLKALMTFDKIDINYAVDSMKNNIEVSSSLRKEQSMTSTLSSMFFGGSQKSKISFIKGMNKVNAVAVYAECYLLKAILSILTESNMMTFMKEGLAIRQSYSIYKTCYKYLATLLEEEGPKGLEKNGIDGSFVTAVYLGIGGFNLMLSIMPAKLLRIFEFIGFSGQREFGMKCLALGADWPAEELESPVKQAGTIKKRAVDFYSDTVVREEGLGLRKFVCGINLHMYHVMISSMIQLPACNIKLATKMVDSTLREHKDSFLFLLIRAKVSQTERKLERAILELEKVISVQKDWRQLAHLCFWDLGISHAALGNYEKAATYFEILFKENEWSKAIYLYLFAVLLYEADPIKNKAQVSELLKKIPNHLKKIAGKSVPLEKFVARKARKFLLQKERLFFPVLEIIYLWNGFDLIPDERLIIINKDLDKALLDLDLQQEEGKKSGLEIPYSTFYDDLCLARFFKGLSARELAVPNASLLVPETEIVLRKLTPEQTSGLQYAAKQLEFISLQADEIEYDHWILPFSRYELAALHMRTGDYEKAAKEYQAALNGGYGEDEAGKQKKKASMETSLHIRVHNALQKLEYLRGRSDAEEGKEEAEED